MALLKRECPKCGGTQARRITFGRNARFWERQLEEGTARLASDSETSEKPRRNCECVSCGERWSDPNMPDRREITAKEAKDPRFLRVDRYWKRKVAGRK